MDTFTALWTGAALATFGALVAYVLGRIDASAKGHEERRGHLRALRGEIDRAGVLAAGYLAGRVLAPTTRLPQNAYLTSFPALVRAGVLTEAEVGALYRFFDNADGFNRSLDSAQGMQADRVPELVAEAMRSRVKADKVATGQPQQVEALAIVTRHLEAPGMYRQFWTGAKRRLLFWRG